MNDRKKQAKLELLAMGTGCAMFAVFALCFWVYAALQVRTDALLTLGPIERTYTVEELARNPPAPGTRIAIEPARLEWGAGTIELRGDRFYEWYHLRAPGSPGAPGAGPDAPGVLFLDGGRKDRFLREPMTGRDRYVGFAWPASTVLHEGYTTGEYELPGVDVGEACAVVHLASGHVADAYSSAKMFVWMPAVLAFVAMLGFFNATPKERQKYRTSAWTRRQQMLAAGAIVLAVGVLGYAVYHNHTGPPPGITVTPDGVVVDRGFARLPRWASL